MNVKRAAEFRKKTWTKLKTSYMTRYWQFIKNRVRPFIKMEVPFKSGIPAHGGNHSSSTSKNSEAELNEAYEYLQGVRPTSGRYGSIQRNQNFGMTDTSLPPPQVLPFLHLHELCTAMQNNELVYTRVHPRAILLAAVVRRLQTDKTIKHIEM